MQLARVIGVGVQRGDRKGNIFACDANLLPVERRGDLQRNVRERSLAVIAHRHEAANGDLVRGGVKPHIEIEAGKGDGAAVGVFKGRLVTILPAELTASSESGCVWPFSSSEREKMTLPLGFGASPRQTASREQLPSGQFAPRTGLQPERRQPSRLPASGQ